MTRIDRALMQQCILLITLLVGLTFLPHAYAINPGNEDLKKSASSLHKIAPTGAPGRLEITA